VGGDSFDKDNVEGADKATNGESLDPIARTVFTIANEHAALRFRRELLAMGVIEVQICRASEGLKVGKVNFLAVQESVRDTTSAP
jgi:hypothetical protein